MSSNAEQVEELATTKERNRLARHIQDRLSEAICPHLCLKRRDNI